MKTITIGVLAHVDAGKTSLTERLLFNNGVIHTLGSVDKGNTQTDYLALERKRGITIRSAVTSFTIDNVKINLLDTPGHPDFIAEVERVLSVLDGVILVISAVEGVQAQTIILMQALQRLKVPTIIFVNKIDRMGARYEDLIQDISFKLEPNAIAMGTVSNLGTKFAKFVPRLNAGYSGCPIFFGSAVTNTGINSLMQAIKSLPVLNFLNTAPLSGTVFKIERIMGGEKIAYIRLFSGTLNIRDKLDSGKVKTISIFEDGGIKSAKLVHAGDIAKISGLSDIKIGDTIGEPRSDKGCHHFAPPIIETVINPIHKEDKGRLHIALDQLAEQDPLINLRQDDIRQEISLSLYGEIQKEVIRDTLDIDYGIQAKFSESTTICVEKLVDVGSAVEYKPTSRVGAPELNKKVNQFLATVGLRVEPGIVNSGVEFKLASAASGKMPAAFYKAVEETVLETLNQGLYGWRVVDCKVTMTHAGYWPRQSSAHGGFDKNISSTARDFRYLTPLVLVDSLQSAGVEVCEPIHTFRLTIPIDSLDAVINLLIRLGANPPKTEKNIKFYVLEGEIVAKNVYSLQKQLPGITAGEGVLESSFSNYKPVHGKPPLRLRTDNNPINRKKYLLNILNKN